MWSFGAFYRRVIESRGYAYAIHREFVVLVLQSAAHNIFLLTVVNAFLGGHYGFD